MDLNAKTQYMAILREKYLQANKAGKGLILNEYCNNTGEKRKYAIKKFNYKVKIKEKRKKRKEYYDHEFTSSLVSLWKMFDCPCGQRLESCLRKEVDRLRKVDELDCSDEVAEKLKKIGSATIDRKLKHEKEVMKINRKYKNNRSFPLKDEVPVKTSEDLDRTRPGTVQIDFVEHCGSSASGQYINSLSIVDIYSGWWTGAAVIGKGQETALIAIDEILKRFPFLLLEMHPDNGTNLMNYYIYQYAFIRSIALSRSRPYKKNDNCFVEEKNSVTIRKNVGYLRHDTEEEMKIIIELYRDYLEPYNNFFLPVIKLKSKERVNGKICKKYDKPKTPYERLMESEHISEEKKKELTTIYESLNPAELKRGIDKKIKELDKAHSKKKGSASRSKSLDLKDVFGVKINDSFRSLSVS